MAVLDIESLKAYSLGDETLRDYQQDNKQKVYDAWGRTNSVMLQMPTGTGKTRLFVSIIKDIFHYGRDNKVAIKVLVLVHRTELIDQIDEELGYRYNLAHGIIQSGEKERKIYPIQLASVQTLSRRLDSWTDKEFDFIIVDEAHHIEAESYQKIIKAFPRAKLLGVTATPVRLSGEGFTGTFNELIVSPSVKTFINRGYLSSYKYYSVGRNSFIQRSINDIKKFNQGDYAESEMERVCDNDRIRAEVVKTYLEYAKGKKGIVYTINKRHNKHLCEKFIENGVSAVAIDSDTPANMRQEYIASFRNGDIDIICNVNLFTEGFDCPDIEFIQLARPTKSLALYLQQVGRGLRISEDKEETLFLDNVGLYNRFGFPSSRRHWKHHFEGRYIGNKTEVEVEGKKEINTEDIIKRKRHQNLTEGNEIVHLIQTTEDKEYLEKRTEELKEWLTDVYVKIIKAYRLAFKDCFVEGLALTSEISEKEFYFCYHIYMKKQTPALTHRLKTDLIDPCECDENGNYIDKGLRNYKDISELVHTIDLHMQFRKLDYFKKDLKALWESYKNLHFNISELIDIEHSMIEEKWCLLANPDAIDKTPMHFIRVVLEFLMDYALSYKKGFTTIFPLMEGIKHNLAEQ